MKKTLLFLFLSLAMMGCKEEQKENQNVIVETKTPASTSTTDCENNPLMRFLGDLTHSERAEWLKKYGDAICLYELYDCVEKIHNLQSEKIFNDMANAHDENRTTNGIKFSSIPWGDITKFITDYDMKCYEDYIGFYIDANNKITLKKMAYSHSDINTTTYSVPLFEGIKRAHPNAETVHFTKAIIPFCEKSGIFKREGIIFKVEDSDGEFSYYDISDNPTKKDCLKNTLD